MNLLTTSHKALLALGWGRTKRFMAALTSASLIFGSIGTPVALATGTTSGPAVGSAEWLAALTSAINFGYGNTIVLLTLNLTQNQYQVTNNTVTNNVTNNNDTTNNNNNTNNVSPVISVNPTIVVSPTITNTVDNSSSSNSAANNTGNNTFTP